jgi:hypothetical protein
MVEGYTLENWTFALARREVMVLLEELWRSMRLRVERL